MSDDIRVVKAGVSHTLAIGWGLTDYGSIEFGAKLTDKAFVHGSDLTGDGKVSGRTIVLKFDVQGDTEETFNTAMNEAYYWLTGEFDLYVGRADRVYHVAACSKIKGTNNDGYKFRWLDIEVSLLLADPFRYATSPTTISNEYEVAQIETPVTFTNPSSIDVPLVFTFTPLVSMPEIIIGHVESGQSFTLADTVLATPAVAVVDAKKGTVYRDANNSINTLSGLFLHALPGSNTYKVSCAAGRVDISYTGRWFV